MVPSIDETFAIPVEVPDNPWIRVKCACGYTVKAPKEWSGRKGNCPKCSKIVLMPLPEPEVDPDELLGNDDEAPFLPPAPAKSEDPRMASGILQLTHDVDEEVIVPDPEPEGAATKTTAPPTLPARKRRVKTAVCATAMTLALAFMALQLSTPDWMDRLSFRFSTSTGPATITLNDAVKKNDVDQIKANLKEGADVNKPNAKGLTPLSAAAVRGDLEAVKLLVSHGANIAEVDKSGRTPLHWASGSGRADVVQYLIEKGADVNAPDIDGATPLKEATLFGHKAVVDLLTQHHASLTFASAKPAKP